MPGSLSVRRRNAEGVNPFNVPNATRTFLQGVTYANADEMEAALRAAMKLDPSAYTRERDRIRAELERYASANPRAAFGLETAGMLGGAMLTPQIAAGRALSPAARFVVGGLDDAAQGALYAAGQANTMNEIPQTIREEAPINAAFYGGFSAAGAGGRRLARKAVGTQRGYDAVMRLKNLFSRIGR